MSNCTVFVLLVSLAVAVCSAQNHSQSLRRPPMAYELYSWEARHGVWSFCLLPSPSGVNIEAQQVLNKKLLLGGVDALNARVSTLPPGATIYWLDHLSGSGTKAIGAHKLSYPPAKIVEQVQHVAETRHVEIEMLGRPAAP